MAALAVAAAALIAGLAGVMLASGSGTASPQRHPAAHRQTTPPPTSPPEHSSSAQTVQVNGSALIGQPVDAVTQRLRQLGLRVHVTMVRTDQQAPGTVVSVQPGGQVAAGGSVTVTAALAPAGHAADGHHHGDGNGKGGGGNGQGGD